MSQKEILLSMGRDITLKHMQKTDSQTQGDCFGFAVYFNACMCNAICISCVQTDMIGQWT